MTEQLELREWYPMRIELPEKGGSLFDLRDVSIYLLTRYAKEGRARFAAGMALEFRLTRNERRLFLSWLRRNGLIHLLDYPGSYDDGPRGKGKGRRQEQYGKEGPHQPGRKSVPGMAGIDGGATPLFGDDDPGIHMGPEPGREGGDGTS